jgi:hypothetical protein
MIFKNLKTTIKMKKIIYILSCLFILGLSGLNAQNAPIMTMGQVTQAGNVTYVPVTVSNFTNIAAFNLKIQFDGTILELTNISLGPAVYPTGGISFNNSVPGIVTIGWYGNPSLSLSNGSVLLFLHFDKIADGFTDVVFVDDNNSLSCLFYDYPNYTPLNDSPSEDFYVNGSVTFEPLPPAPVTSIPFREACVGDIVEFPVTVTDFNNVGAASFFIRYNDSVLTNPVFTNTSNVIPFSDFTGTPGLIILSGHSMTFNGNTLPDNSVLFTLSFTYLGGTTDIYFDHTYASNCQYGGPPQFFEPLEDIPKEDFYINGRMSPETVPPMSFH